MKIPDVIQRPLELRAGVVVGHSLCCDVCGRLFRSGREYATLRGLENDAQRHGWDPFEVLCPVCIEEAA